MCKDMEDHTNRKYQVAMQGRLNNIGQYQVSEMRQANNCNNYYKKGILAKDKLWLHGLSVISGPQIIPEKHFCCWQLIS